MYNSSMHRINRSPEAGEGGGNLPDTGAAGGGEGGAASGAAATPEYVGKSDFEAFQNEFRQTIARLTPREQAAQDRKESGTPGVPSKPDMSKYDFKNDPNASDRYMSDYYKYQRHLEKTEEAKENEVKQSAEKSKKDIQGHQARTSDYAKSNPGYVADMKAAAGKINVIDPVAKAIYGSKNGHLAVHYMAKNPGADQELNLLADSDGPDAVRERIGEMAAEMRAQSKALEGNAAAAGAKPPRFSTRGSAIGGAKKPTAAERFARFNS